MSSSDREARPRRAGRAGALAALGLLAVLASACTVRPVYMPIESSAGTRVVGADLAAIDVGQVGDRVGQEVRNNLVFAFTGGRAPLPARYKLDISVSNYETRLGFERDETAPSYQVTVSVRYELKDLATGRSVLRSQASGVASYDRSNQNFANIRARVDAEDRAAQAVADQIQLRLSIALSKEKPRAPAAPAN